MKLTKAQLNKLINQHTGTGYIIIKISDTTIRIADIGVTKKAKWYLGLDGKPLTQKLDELAKEIMC